MLTRNRPANRSQLRRPLRHLGWTLLTCLVVAGVGVAVVQHATLAPLTAEGNAPAGDGRVGEDRVTVHDTDHPTIAGLDPALREALAAATAQAASDGVEVLVTSGWRSREYQAELLEAAVAKYGSPREAARWVATPDTSRHVLGEAVDVGPTGAAYWMAEHGSDVGLCQVFANEVWHYELLTTPGGQCPAMRPDGSS